VKQIREPDPCVSLYPKDKSNVFNSLYVKSFGHERNRITNLSLLDMLIFLQRYDFFELQLKFSCKVAKKNTDDRRR
jgi:hypothetical protein